MDKIKDTTKKDSHYARLRRSYRETSLAQKNNKRAAPITDRLTVNYNYAVKDAIYLYGIHTVLAALTNKKRRIYKLLATKNALEKIKKYDSFDKLEVEIVDTHTLNKIFNHTVIHQGVIAIAHPLEKKSIGDLKNSRCVVLLDQITDPHNIGAIMRSCVAFDIDAIITTSRHSPSETGVLAKTASGALDMLDYIIVTNLCNALNDLHQLGFTSIGLDSEGSTSLEDALRQKPISKLAIILGAEGKGLRERTRITVNHLANLPMPGKIKSLNVSNAAAITLYIATNQLDYNLHSVSQKS